MAASTGPNHEHCNHKHGQGGVLIGVALDPTGYPIANVVAWQLFVYAQEVMSFLLGLAIAAQRFEQETS